MDMFIILMVKASQCIHIPKLIKLYTLKMSSLQYVNYIFIKLLNKKRNIDFFKRWFPRLPNHDLLHSVILFSRI